MKIAHISDLHFGMHQPVILTAFLQEVALNQPDLILISGDLTQRGRIHQYQELCAFLKQLPAQTLTVPGNHDIPLYNSLARFICPFRNYKRYVNPQTTSIFENSGLRILGVNSVNPFQLKDGNLPHETLDSIKHYFNTQDEKLNLLFFHHNFDYLEGLHKPLKNAQEFLSYLKQSPIHLVCTGHLHYSHLSLITKNNNYPCLALHAGSLLCTRSKDHLNSYYLIETNQQRCAIYWRVFNHQAFSTRSSYFIDFDKKQTIES